MKSPPDILIGILYFTHSKIHPIAITFLTTRGRSTPTHLAYDEHLSVQEAHPPVYMIHLASAPQKILSSILDLIGPKVCMSYMHIFLVSENSIFMVGTLVRICRLQKPESRW